MPNLQAMAAHYYRSKGSRPTPEERDTFHRWLLLQFSRIADRVDFTPDELTPEQFLLVHAITGKLLISTAHNVHPHWLPRENAMLRAVHDWCHLRANCGFDLDGEIEACEYAKQSAPESIHWILESETCLQAAACLAAGGVFPRQKLVRQLVRN